jgi:hypothetical protein
MLLPKARGFAMFIRPMGLNYYNFLAALHHTLLFDWYMEIGCRKGDSFAPVRSKTIAVDPFFQAEINIIGKKPVLHLFQMTSDDFFARKFMERNGIQLGVSFLDGMHLYEYLLRDFMNTEAASHPAGVILMHDCVPFDHGMTTRDLDNIPRGAWTGDVWKLIPILQRWRPDLKLTILDSRPTALVAVTNLSPRNRVLQEAEAEIHAEFGSVDLETWGVERFFQSFTMVSALDCARGGFQLFRPASIDPSLAINPRRITP